MSGYRAEALRRCAQIDAIIEARLAEGDAELAAIEVVPDDAGRRDEDLRLVRGALDDGASPSDLGSVVVTVATNFAYEVDWKDQFCFWPRMHEHIRSGALDLRDDPAARRAVERAFQGFTRRWRGVRPVGGLRDHFPLMSWPLVHAVMPWCAQRHVARVLERAAAEGLLPDDAASPWPEGAVETLASSMRVPVFVAGLIENPTVLARLGRALLGDAPRPDAPTWVRRLRRNVEGDAVARSLVSAARESQRERVSARSSRAPGLPVSLMMQVVGEHELGLWASLGPYGRAVGSTSEALAFARAGASLLARVDGRDAGGAPLFNALTAPVLVEVKWAGSALRLQPSARAYEGSDVPETLKRAEEGAERAFSLPLLFHREDERRFALAASSVHIGDDVAVLAASASSLADRLKARGFAPCSVRGAPHLLALVGKASDAAAPDLADASVTVKERAPVLVPALFPPLRRDGERLVYRAGRDLWLILRDSAEALTAAVVDAGDAEAEAEVGIGDAGEALIRVPAAALSLGLNKVRAFSRSRARAHVSVEVIIEAPAQQLGLSRWRVALHPAGASVEHLLANQCWLEVEAMPGVRVEVELSRGTEARSLTLDEGDRGPFDTATRLRELAAELIPPGDDALGGVEVRARSVDEPEGWASVATLGASDTGLHFVVTGAAPAVLAPDDEPKLWGIEFGADGISMAPVAEVELSTDGLYLAMAGESRAALCSCGARSRIPRLPKAMRFTRSVERTVDLLGTLRAVDVAALWPERTRASGVMLRRAAARAIERELVGSLCGASWVRMEDERLEESDELDALTSKVARLLWLDERRLKELVDDEGEDPLDLLRALLEETGERGDAPEARHLALTFYQRGMTSRARDEAAARWAWSGVRRARVARACYLLAPDALADAARASDDDDA